MGLFKKSSEGSTDFRLVRDDIAVISGIGCSSRTPGYVDFNTLHTLHGRALAYATGVKLANPNSR